MATFVHSTRWHPGLCPKWHPIPYIVHYLWPRPFGLWSKVVPHIGNRVPFGMNAFHMDSPDIQWAVIILKEDSCWSLLTVWTLALSPSPVQTSGMMIVCCQLLFYNLLEHCSYYCSMSTMAICFDTYYVKYITVYGWTRQRHSNLESKIDIQLSKTIVIIIL